MKTTRTKNSYNKTKMKFFLAKMKRTPFVFFFCFLTCPSSLNYFFYINLNLISLNWCLPQFLKFIKHVEFIRCAKKRKTQHIKYNQG